mmetsp:Transcript_108149/g.316218  ORF Transcript_108149/g.316218 Transcript_108149/m.316218 type:complete len:206 (-) Transcript_108149:144-761(-)
MKWRKKPWYRCTLPPCVIVIDCCAGRAVRVVAKIVWFPFTVHSSLNSKRSSDSRGSTDCSVDSKCGASEASASLSRRSDAGSEPGSSGLLAGRLETGVTGVQAWCSSATIVSAIWTLRCPGWLMFAVAERAERSRRGWTSGFAGNVEVRLLLLERPCVRSRKRSRAISCAFSAAFAAMMRSCSSASCRRRSLKLSLCSACSTLAG